MSKDYLRELKKRLLASKDEFSDKEWAGLMRRFDRLEAEAPDKIDGELPLGEMT